jgi:NAD(P)-dependent dehydrogenase (short-subunit alcohol dehydrogenase family)
MKSIVITGSSSGFGREAAERFASLGHRVFATMRNVEGSNAAAASELRSLASQNHWQLSVVELDVTDGASVTAAADFVVEQGGAPDVVVNNAGVMFIGLTEAYAPEEVAWQLDVNVVGPHRVCRAFLPSMRSRGRGLIINVSSVAGRIAMPFSAVYNASKWALEAYSIGLRREIAQTGIDVVLVEPGPSRTGLSGQGPAAHDAEERIETYPEVIRQAFAGMLETSQGMLEDPALPTAASHVVDRFAELVEMEPGTRPLRSVVGIDPGVAARNIDDERHDELLLEAIGMTEFARLRA